MRISMVSEHASPLAALGGVDAGGQNVYVAALASALARRGHQVTVYTRRDDPALPDRVDAAPGVEVVHVTAGPARVISKDEMLPFMGDLARGIEADWMRVRPDVVHAHFWMSGLAAVQAAAAANARFVRSRVPVIQTFHALGTVKRRHQGAEDTSPAEREHLEPWVGSAVDAVLATCSDEVRELEAMGVTPEKISVAPCGVDTELLTPDGPAEARSRPYRIGAVGRLVPRKGVDLVIRALALLPGDLRDQTELLIVGGPDEAEVHSDPECRRLAGLARELGVDDRVHLRGRVAHDELPAVLRSLDAIVCAPWYEPFGIVPLEAAAAGVPLVGAAVGGLLDSVVDGVTGLHVPPRDEAAIAAALERLLRDPALRDRLGRGARERACRLYTWDRVAELTEAVYRTTVSSQHVAAPAAVGL